MDWFACFPTGQCAAHEAIGRISANIDAMWRTTSKFAGAAGCCPEEVGQLFGSTNLDLRPVYTCVLSVHVAWWVPPMNRNFRHLKVNQTNRTEAFLVGLSSILGLTFCTDLALSYVIMSEVFSRRSQSPGKADRKRRNYAKTSGFSTSEWAH